MRVVRAIGEGKVRCRETRRGECRERRGAERGSGGTRRRGESSFSLPSLKGRGGGGEGGGGGQERRERGRGGGVTGRSEGQSGILE